MSTYSTSNGGLELIDVKSAMFSCVDATDREYINAPDRFNIVFTKAADAMASTTTAETVLGTVPRARIVGATSRAYKLVGLVYGPAAALTSSDTTYATITVAYRTSAGGSGATIGTFTTTTTSTGDWVQWAPVEGVVSTTPTVTAGGIITLSIAKASTGVVVPAGVLTLDFVQA